MHRRFCFSNFSATNAKQTFNQVPVDLNLNLNFEVEVEVEIKDQI